MTRPSAHLSAPSARRRLEWVSSAISDRVALGLGLVLVAMVVLVIFAFRSTGNVAADVERLGSEDLELFDQAWQIRFLDEELTLAASRYIDADPVERVMWRTIYDESASALDETLAATSAAVDPADRVHLDQVSDANDQLIALEATIFDLSDQGLVDEARGVLSGEYAAQKDVYRKGIDAHFASQQQRFDSQIDAVVSETLGARVMVSVVLGVITLVIAFVARINHVQKLQARERENERERFSTRQLRQSEVRDAFEMSMTERDALLTFAAALRQELPGWRSELLLADSSTAHLHRSAVTDSGSGEPGCGVATPTDCPAIRRATTLTFADADRFSSCPHLRDRDLDGGTAVCIPLKVMGKSIGITHSIAPDRPTRPELDRLSEIVQTGGDRIGVLRAFATTRRQAARDPLTGLHNRRSLEQEAHALDGTGRTYCVAFCDLDEFKSLNDTHGHGTGDRAIRLFGQTLTSTLRPTDLVARWGGEEFVVVFTDTQARHAVDALERVREALTLALMNGDIPQFTFSAGVADAISGFADTTASADAALLEAKHRGRNRIVHAADIAPDADAPSTTTPANPPATSSSSRSTPEKETT